MTPQPPIVGIGMSGSGTRSQRFLPFGPALLALPGSIVIGKGETVAYQIVARTLPEQPTLAMRGKADAEHLGSWLAGAYRALGDHAAATGARFSGPPYATYRALDTELGELEIEAGFPLRSPGTGNGTVEAASLPGGLAATTWHIGPYDSLACAHEAVDAWIAARGGRLDGHCWEVYYSDPVSEPDSSRWRTEVVKLYG